MNLDEMMAKAAQAGRLAKALELMMMELLEAGCIVEPPEWSVRIHEPQSGGRVTTSWTRRIRTLEREHSLTAGFLFPEIPVERADEWFGAARWTAVLDDHCCPFCRARHGTLPLPDYHVAFALLCENEDGCRCVVASPSAPTGPPTPKGESPT